MLSDGDGTVEGALMTSGACIEDHPIGRVVVSAGRTITEADIVAFAGLSWDTHPAHTNEEYARRSAFGRRVAHGALTFSCAIGLLNKTAGIEEAVLAFLAIERWEFKAAVCPGDTVHLRITTTDVRISRSKPDRGIWTGRIEVLNQHDAICQQGTLLLLMRARGSGPPSV